MSRRSEWTRKLIRGRAELPCTICPGRVARRIFPPLARHTVVAAACQGVAEHEFGGFSHSSVRDLARVVAGRGEIVTMSPAPVQRILTALILKPQRGRSFLTRTDPVFEEQRAEIIELSRHPPRHCRVRCLDEKTPLQALERWHPTLPLRPGLVERQEFEYLRQGTVDLFAAFEVGTGQGFAQCSQRHTNLEFRHFLRAWRARDPDSRWPLIMDNAGYHKKQAVLDWCAAQRPKVTLHWVPTQGSWLNQVEIWFSLLSRKCLRRASGCSTPDLRTLIHRFLKTWNTHFAPPFEGTYTGKPLAVAPQHYELLAA
jgi:transposase